MNKLISTQTIYFKENPNIEPYKWYIANEEDNFANKLSSLRICYSKINNESIPPILLQTTPYKTFNTEQSFSDNIALIHTTNNYSCGKTTKLQNIIAEAERRFKVVNGKDYCQIEQCKAFLSIIDGLCQFTEPILTLYTDAIRTSVFLAGNSFTLRQDFDFPDVIFASTFVRNNESQKVFVLKEFEPNNFDGIKNFILNPNA